MVATPARLTVTGCGNQAINGIGNGMEQPADTVTVAAVNFHAVWGDKAANLGRILALAREAAARGAKIVLFPETALTGYNHDGKSVAMHEANAETVPGPAAEALADCARELGIWLTVGLPERDAATGTIYNSALVAGPEGIVDCYRKIHLPGDESLWARKGDRPCLFDTPWGPVGLGICYDSYVFPELARYYAALGARIYLNPTAMPKVPNWEELYYTGLKARVLENAFFIVSANLTGEDRDVTFPGDSLILGPGKGPINPTIHGGPAKEEDEIVVATIDLSRCDRTRNQLPILKDNPLTGEPDWRPGVYARLLDDVRVREGWRDR
ncbi:MAG: carbon-nitrogen hydrolase family protein [Novosphingobium sp.]|nr:carbon-nitrogen hydrolase family protein [Novosphingobium sp.]